MSTTRSIMEQMQDFAEKNPKMPSSRAKISLLPKEDEPVIAPTRRPLRETELHRVRIIPKCESIIKVQSIENEMKKNPDGDFIIVRRPREHFLKFSHDEITNTPIVIEERRLKVLVDAATQTESNTTSATCSWNAVGI